jgi:DNA-binding protein HU-beta
MTKTELQIALATATQTNKRTAGVFLDMLSNLAYKAIKKNGEFVLPGFGKLVKQKRKARTGFNPKTQQKIKIPAKTVVKFRVAKVAKDAILASGSFAFTAKSGLVALWSKSRLSTGVSC